MMSVFDIFQKDQSEGHLIHISQIACNESWGWPRASPVLSRARCRRNKRRKGNKEKKENTPESAPWERVSQKMQMQDELVMSLRRRLIAPLPATVMFCSAHRFPDKELNRPSDDSCLVCPRRCLVSSYLSALRLPCHEQRRPNAVGCVTGRLTGSAHPPFRLSRRQAAW